MQTLSRLHIDDLASAILACLDQELSGTFNLGDDEPATLHDTVIYLCERLQIPLPQILPLAEAPDSLQNSRWVVSDAFRARTGWRPRYPSYREGFDAILSAGA